MASKRFKYPLVVVLWEDAHSDSDWVEMAEMKTHPVLVTSAGFLIHDDEASVVMTLGYSDDSVLDRIRIPKGMVRHMLTLREAA